MKKHFEFTDIGLEDLALVGGGCRKRCEPPPCNPCDPCGKKNKIDMTMSTAPSSAGLATIPGAPSGGIDIDVTIGGLASLPGDDDKLSYEIPGASVSIAT